MDSTADTSKTSESELNSSSGESSAAGEEHQAADTAAEETYKATSSTNGRDQMSTSKEGPTNEDQQQQQRQQYQEAMAAAQMRFIQQQQHEQLQGHTAAGNGSSSSEQAMMMMPGMMPFMMPSYQMMMQQQSGAGFMSHEQNSRSRESDHHSAAGSPLNLQTSGRGSADPNIARHHESTSSTQGGFPHSMEHQIRPAHQGNDMRQRSSPAGGGSGVEAQISGGGGQPHAAHHHNNPHQMHHGGAGMSNEAGGYGSHMGSVAGQTGSNVTSATAAKPDIPAPPKRPLTPYMRFSKMMWQQVKAANPGMSVCEIGATIGRLWRELSNEEKQRHNDDFTLDKVRYDTELKSYLKTTGLHASDLVKKPKKKEPPKAAPPKRLLPPTPTSAPSRPSPTSNIASSSHHMDNHHQQQHAAVAAAAAHQQAMQQQQLAQSFMGLPISSMAAAGTLPMGMPMGMLTGFPQMWAAQQYGGLNMASGLQLAHQQAAAHHDLYAAGMAGAANGQPHGEAGPADPSHMAQMYLHSQNFM